MRQVKGIEDLGVFRVLGQPNLNVNRGPRRRRALPDQRSRRAGCYPDRRRRQCAHARSCRAKRAMTCRSAISRNTATLRKISKIFACSRPPGNASRSASSAISRVADGGRRSIAKATSATSRSNTVSADATWAAPSKRRSKRSASRSSFPTGYHLDWDGEYASQKRANAPPAHRSADHDFHLSSSSSTPFQIIQVGSLIMANVAIAPIGGVLALLLTGTHFSVSSGRWFSGAVWRFCANRRHHARVH